MRINAARIGITFFVTLLIGTAVTGAAQEQAEAAEQESTEAERSAQAGGEADGGGQGAQETQGEAGEAQAQAGPLTVPSGADGAVRLRNIGTSLWRISDTEGSGLYVDRGGSMIYMEVGGRYHIDLSTVDSSHLPLDLRSLNGQVLISQRENVGTLSSGEVDPQVSTDGISFTLTEELAGRLVYYRAATYPDMVGFFRAVAPEGAEEGETAEGGGEAGNGAAAGGTAEDGTTEDGTDQGAE